MRRNLISLFFLSIFSFLICAPAFVLMTDNEHDFILFADLTEEEKKENENVEKLEIKLTHDEKQNSSFLSNDGVNEFHFRDALYSHLHREISSPPPEQL